MTFNTFIWLTLVGIGIIPLSKILQKYLVANRNSLQFNENFNQIFRDTQKLLRKQENLVDSSKYTNSRIRKN